MKYNQYRRPLPNGEVLPLDVDGRTWSDGSNDFHNHRHARSLDGLGHVDGKRPGRVPARETGTHLGVVGRELGLLALNVGGNAILTPCGN